MAFYNKISFYISLHIIVALVLVIVNKTDYFNIFTLSHFIIEISRFIFQKYGLYKILFFTILNVFSAVFTFYNKQNNSLEADLCQNYFNHVEIRLFSIHPLYFESILFLQLFNDLGNHLFQKKISDSNVCKYILRVSLFLLTFVNFCWAILHCQLDFTNFRTIVIVFESVCLAAAIVCIFFENNIRLFEILEYFDYFNNRHLTKVYETPNEILNDYNVCEVTRSQFNFLNMLNHDYYFELRELHNKNKITLLKSYLIVNSVLAVFFMDFYYFNDCIDTCNLTNVLYKNLLKIAIMFIFVTIVKINLSQTLKHFLIMYPICVSFVMLSVLFIPKWSVETLPSNHIYENITNDYFDTQDELSMYSLELQLFLKVLYTILSFPFYYFTFVKLYDHGIVSSIATLSLLNLEVTTFTSFFINVCITTIVILFSYMFKFMNVYTILKTFTNNNQLCLGHIKFDKFVYYNELTNIYIVSETEIKDLKYNYIKRVSKPKDDNERHIIVDNVKASNESNFLNIEKLKTKIIFLNTAKL